VITGGIEAQYGDVTGGVISITTKGPSSRYSGGFEVESSYGLDPYGYLLGMANLAGPLIKNKKTGKPILGFRVSGQYIRREEDDPPAINVYQVKEDVLAELEANPIVRVGSGFAPAAEFLDFDDVNELRARPNEQNTRYDLTAKLDARLGQNIDVAFTGTYNFVENYFTPSNFSTSSNAQPWNVFNSHNNPFTENSRYRANVRLRHRLGRQGGGEDTGGSGGALIQNASYTLQFGYERSLSNLSDPRHQDRFFDYGYVGQFDFDFVEVLGSPIDPTTWPFPVPLQHRDFNQQFQGYTPGDVNPVLANYNNVLADVAAPSEFIAENGFTPQNFAQVWGLHANVGTVYNLYQKTDNETYTFTANSSFELVPGGSEKGRHNIQFGIWYEQRTDRAYSLNPRGLWIVADQQANRHILGVDTTNIVGDTIVFNTAIPLYGKQTTELEDGAFYRNVREATGTPLDEFVNVDELTPDQLRLDMFSAFELTNQNLVDYFGFDYLGNMQQGVTFDDFFTSVDENGVRTFPVAPYQPIYTAAYIQDKFTFKDIIFRVGLRVDRFDANTRVLKDPYSLYEIQNAQDFHAQVGSDRPETIGDDFAVYVESEGSDVVKAYRDADQWYFPNGTQANDGNLIFGGELVFPRYTVEDPNIQSRDFDPSISFQDYEPQTNFMPRLAFSFPISDEANFFAHYDILVQRPPSNNFATALDFYYFQERTGIRNNPALRPERTVDYEVGFQQKLTQSSAIKIAAYYKEMRDMVQSRVFGFVAAPINSYTTYDNLDFGTVKGFTFQYDLRRTGNISLQLAYTLQFADGTGSDANSSRNLTNVGIQRVLYPLNFDERHRFNLTMDYRYGSGKNYNGPTLFGADILANTGINLQGIAVSGRPYTRQNTPDLFGGAGTVGSINGARLPWNMTFNARIDRDFFITPADSDRPLSFNVYLRVSNVFNRANIIRVYPVTGSPEDDGYLASSIGQQDILTAAGTGRPVESFLASYQWRMLNPNFFSLPRRMFVGLIFNF
jgi:hypothetical protein